MPIKTYKPTSPGKRHRTNSDFAGITRGNPEKNLVLGLRKKGGRNHQGKITMRHRGGGGRKKYRLVDFKRDKEGVPAYVASIEYDPNRSARIALLHYRDGGKRYIIAPADLRVGDEVISGENAPPKPGNSLPLREIPDGSSICNIELMRGGGGRLVRAAGTFAQLLNKEGKYAQIRLPSGEIRLVSLECRATIGRVGNVNHENIQIGKAGRTRWLGRRPRVRGVAMNPVDHPHGGGEDRGHIGGPPVTPWGKSTKGRKTRKKRKSSDKLILQRKKNRR